jgi:hypothetical protein
MMKRRIKSAGTGTAVVVIGAAAIWLFTVIVQSLSGLSDLSMGIALISASVLALVIVIRAQTAKAPKISAHEAPVIQDVRPPNMPLIPGLPD